MIRRITKTRSIEEQLRKDGKAYFLDKPEHLGAIMAMNEQLEAAKREYETKERNSQAAASAVILNS
jgi:hypothetical protein